MDFFTKLIISQKLIEIFLLFRIILYTLISFKCSFSELVNELQIKNFFYHLQVSITSNFKHDKYIFFDKNVLQSCLVTIIYHLRRLKKICCVF